MHGRALSVTSSCKIQQRSASKRILLQTNESLIALPDLASDQREERSQRLAPGRLGRMRALFAMILPLGTPRVSSARLLPLGGGSRAVSARLLPFRLTAGPFPLLLRLLAAMMLE